MSEDVFLKREIANVLKQLERNYFERARLAQKLVELNAARPDDALRWLYMREAVVKVGENLGIAIERSYATKPKEEPKEPVTFDSVMEQAYEIRNKAEMEMLPPPELRASSYTIGIIGNELARYTTKAEHPYTLLTSGELYGMRIDIDDSVPDGEIKAIHPNRIVRISQFVKKEE